MVYIRVSNINTGSPFLLKQNTSVYVSTGNTNLLPLLSWVLFWMSFYSDNLEHGPDEIVECN